MIATFMHPPGRIDTRKRNAADGVICPRPVCVRQAGGSVVAHHVPDDALLAYAAGSSSVGEDLLVACHLTLCPACREAVDAADRVAAALAARAPAADLPPDALGHLLARLDDPAPVAPPPAPPCPYFPAPLRRAVGPLASVRWRPVGFGVGVSPLPVGGGHQRVFLMDFPPGLRLPSHGHDGVERGLVLRGGFTADGRAYARGDVSWQDEPHHDVVVDDDGERCTTLFVSDGPMTFGSGWIDRFADWWLGMGG
jgi:putative transcriptional regulator